MPVTPTDRYLFDMTGYLHIRGAVRGDALAAAQDAAERCIMAGSGLDGHPAERPEGFVTKPAEMEPHEYGNRPGIGYQHGFAFDRGAPARPGCGHPGPSPPPPSCMVLTLPLPGMQRWSRSRCTRRSGRW